MSIQKITKIVAVSATLFFSSNAGAVIIERGLDYFETSFATHPLGAPIGDQEFDGLNIVDPFLTTNFGLVDAPTSPLHADTIVERLEDTVDLTVGASDTINIEMVSLSLVSTNPVDLGGSLFDIFITLDLGDDLTANSGDETASTGEMTISTTGTDTNGKLFGTYSSLLLDVPVFNDCFFEV